MRQLLAAVAVTVVTVAVTPSPARADRALPPWDHYQAERSIGLGLVALSRGDLASADRLSGDATEANPDDIDAWRLRCAVLTQQRRWADAGDAALQLTGLAPNDAGAALIAGRVSLELGVFEAASTSYRRAADLDPDDTRGLLGLALVAARGEGDWGVMEEHLRAARGRSERLDLSSLPLQDGWRPVADRPEFLTSLQGVLQDPAPEASDGSTPAAEGPVPPK